jgi:hypothetical protein
MLLIALVVAFVLTVGVGLTNYDNRINALVHLARLRYSVGFAEGTIAAGIALAALLLYATSGGLRLIAFIAAAVAVLSDAGGEKLALTVARPKELTHGA